MQLEAAQREVRTTQGRAESATHELGAKLRQQRRQWAKEKAALKQAEALGLGVGLGLGLRTHGGGLTLTLTLTLALALTLTLTLTLTRLHATAATPPPRMAISWLASYCPAPNRRDELVRRLQASLPVARARVRVRMRVRGKVRDTEACDPALTLR